MEPKQPPTDLRGGMKKQLDHLDPALLNPVEKGLEHWPRWLAALYIVIYVALYGLMFFGVVHMATWLVRAQP